MTDKAGFERVQFLSHDNHGTFYRDLIPVHLRLGAARDGLVLPDWRWRSWRASTALTRPIKDLLMLEGSVVLTKALSLPPCGAGASPPNHRHGRPGKNLRDQHPRGRDRRY